MADSILSPYRGSEATYEAVKAQVRERFGDEYADEFDPYTDAMPLVSWAAYGFRIKRGERALKSVTIMEIKDPDGKTVRKIRRVVNLFHKLQTEKVS